MYYNVYYNHEYQSLHQAEIKLITSYELVAPTQERQTGDRQPKSPPGILHSSFHLLPIRDFVQKEI